MVLPQMETHPIGQDSAEAANFMVSVGQVRGFCENAIPQRNLPVRALGEENWGFQLTGNSRSLVLCVRRFVMKEACEFGVFHDHSGVFLDGIEVLLLKAISCFGGCEDLSRQRNRSASIFRCNF